VLVQAVGLDDMLGEELGFVEGAADKEGDPDGELEVEGTAAKEGEGLRRRRSWRARWEIWPCKRACGGIYCSEFYPDGAQRWIVRERLGRINRNHTSRIQQGSSVYPPERAVIAKAFAAGADVIIGRKLTASHCKLNKVFCIYCCRALFLEDE
jgi:hypothetical protein